MKEVKLTNPRVVFHQVDPKYGLKLILSLEWVAIAQATQQTSNFWMEVQKDDPVIPP